MKTIPINQNNDIYLDASGNLAMAQDLEAMGNIFVNKSQTNKGELPYNTEKGIDFFNTIFSSPCYPDLYQNELLSTLEDTEDTQEVLNFNNEVQNNIYSYSVDIITDYGQVTLNG